VPSVYEDICNVSSVYRDICNVFSVYTDIGNVSVFIETYAMHPVIIERNQCVQ
jgi:hypothetical protein